MSLRRILLVGGARGRVPVALLTLAASDVRRRPHRAGRRLRPASPSAGSGRCSRTATAGDAFTSAFDLRIGVDGLSALLPRASLGAVARRRRSSSRGATSSRPRAAGRSALSPACSCSRSQALVLVARDPLTFLAAWELMTLAAGGGDPRLARADERVAAQRLHLRRGHAPRRRRHVDRDPAARARGRDRRPGRDRVRLRAADRDRARRARRHGDEGRA